MRPRHCLTLPQNRHQSKLAKVVHGAAFHVGGVGHQAAVDVMSKKTGFIDTFSGYVEGINIKEMDIFFPEISQYRVN